MGDPVEGPVSPLRLRLRPLVSLGTQPEGWEGASPRFCDGFHCPKQTGLARPLPLRSGAHATGTRVPSLAQSWLQEEASGLRGWHIHVRSQAHGCHLTAGVSRPAPLPTPTPAAWAIWRQRSRRLRGLDLGNDHPHPGVGVTGVTASRGALPRAQPGWPGRQRTVK